MPIVPKLTVYFGMRKGLKIVQSIKYAQIARRWQCKDVRFIGCRWKCFFNTIHQSMIRHESNWELLLHDEWNIMYIVEELEVEVTSKTSFLSLNVEINCGRNIGEISVYANVPVNYHNER